MRTPDVITRYYTHAAAGDLEALLACFDPDAQVLDEDRTYRGRTEIRHWREAVATKFTYTTQITGTALTGPGVFVVSTHLEGDFPGGVVDLEQRFTVQDGLITDLAI